MGSGAVRIPRPTFSLALAALEWGAESFRGSRTSDKSGQDEDRDDVGKNLDELDGNWLSSPQHHALQPNLDGFRKTKKKARQRGANRVPFAENQRSQSHETAPRSHAARE